MLGRLWDNWDWPSESPGLQTPFEISLLSVGEGEHQDFCFPEILVGSREWLHRLTWLRAGAGRGLQSPGLLTFPLCRNPPDLWLQNKLTLPCLQTRDGMGKETCWQGGAGGAVPRAVLRDSRSPGQCLDLRLPHRVLVRALLHAGAFWGPICSSGEVGCLIVCLFSSVEGSKTLISFFPSEIIYKALSLLLPAAILWRH